MLIIRARFDNMLDQLKNLNFIESVFSHVGEYPWYGGTGGEAVRLSCWKSALHMRYKW